MEEDNRMICIFVQFERLINKQPYTGEKTLINVYYSWPMPFTYLNVSGTYAYAACEQLTCENMSIVEAVFINIDLFSFLEREPNEGDCTSNCIGNFNSCFIARVKNNKWVERNFFQMPFSEECFLILFFPQ